MRPCVCVHVRASRVRLLCASRMQMRSSCVRSCVRVRGVILDELKNAPKLDWKTTMRVFVRVHTSFLLSLLLFLPFTASASRSVPLFLRRFKSASAPKQPDFLLRTAMCDDDILFRACYANRELSSTGERPRDKRRMSTLGRLRKITVVDFARTVYWSLHAAELRAQSTACVVILAAASPR